MTAHRSRIYSKEDEEFYQLKLSYFPDVSESIKIETQNYYKVSWKSNKKVAPYGLIVSFPSYDLAAQTSLDIV